MLIEGKRIKPTSAFHLEFEVPENTEMPSFNLFSLQPPTLDIGPENGTETQLNINIFYLFLLIFYLNIGYHKKLPKRKQPFV